MASLEVNKQQLEDFLLEEVYQIYCDQFQVNISNEYKKAGTSKVF